MAKETLAARAYRQVREDIAERRIRPGDTIVENDICRRCGISKATAGEVLHRLTEEGVMRAIPRRGYQLNIYDDGDFVKIQELRYALEALVMRRVIEGVDGDALLARFDELEHMNNNAFHTTLATLADDEFILDSLRRLLLKVGTTYGNIDLNPEDEADVVRRHRAIIERLAAKDEAGALRALRVDLRLSPEDGVGRLLPVTRKRPFTTAMMAELVYISDPQQSPDGKIVAYTRYKADREDGKFYARAVLRDLKTGAETELGAGRNSRAVRFAPSGAFVSYLSDASGEMQIWARYPDGKEKQLTTLRHGVERYALSPAEERFAFEANLWPAEIEDGSALKEMSEQEKAAWREERDWAPIEITEIDYKRDECKGVRDGSIGVIGTVSLAGRQRLLTKDMPFRNPSFSPDGKRIACYGNPHTGAQFSRQELFVLGASGGKPTQLTHDEFLTGDAPAAFTADGAEVVYPAYFMRDDCMISYLYKRPAKGGDAVCLFDPDAKEICSGVYGMPMCRTQYGEEKPYFCVHGEWIYFVSAWQGRERLYRLPVQGGAPKLVLETEGSIHEFCVPEKGRLLFTGGDTRTPRSLYQWETRGKRLTKLVDPNPWLEKCALGEVTAYDVPCADGAGSVHGWVCKPAEFEAGKKYPAVLYLHGGPEVCYSEDFWHEIQALAGAGFAVAYCDPRGSTGYGLKHGNSEASWGEPAYADMMGFLDFAIGLGFIDPERCGITGGSYGGYMTCKIIMMNHRFKAAVGQRVFVNKATSYGTGDIGFYSAHPSDKKPDVKAWLMQRSRTSIIRDIDNITTPLLLLHGYLDYRCSFEQSEQMFIALHQRRPEVPVRLVMFPGENHGVSRTGLLHFQQRHVQEMIDWFEKYLKAGEANEA